MFFDAITTGALKRRYHEAIVDNDADDNLSVASSARSNSFEGEPDTNGAAGPSQYVETVNQSLELFTRSSGASLAFDNFDHFFFTTGGLSRASGTSAVSTP